MPIPSFKHFGSALQISLALSGIFLSSVHHQAFAYTGCPFAPVKDARFNISTYSPANGEVFTAPRGGKLAIPVKSLVKITLSPKMSAECEREHFSPGAYAAVDGSSIGGNWNAETGLLEATANLGPGTYRINANGTVRISGPYTHSGDAVIIKVLEGPPAPAYGPVLGNIDGIINENGRPFLSGWTCDKNLASSIDLHLYVGGGAGAPGAGFGLSAPANLMREAAVSGVCGTNGIGHGFKIDLSGLQAQHGGKGIYVYGISATGGGNSTLNGSGNFNIPVQTAVLGNIDGLSNNNGRTYLQGWACDKNMARSIDVHMYVGGPVGSGQLLHAFKAEGAREAAVGQVCGTNGVGHGFSVDVSNFSAQHAGKPIYLYGISTSGGANAAIGNAGNFAIPAGR